MSSPDLALSNHLLNSLPAAEYQRLRSHLNPIKMPLGQVLYEINEPNDYVYFPTNAIVSLISPTLDQSATKFCLVGREGLVGISSVLGGGSTISRAVVQIADGAVKIDAQVLKAEFDRGGILQKQILLYFQSLLMQTAQNVACRSHHSVEPRLARWLLSIRDRLQQNNFSITQKYLAELLGTRRASVTEAAGHLQQGGLIRYSRGHITILDDAGLERVACECYALLRDEQQRLHTISQSIH